MKLIVRTRCRSTKMHNIKGLYGNPLLSRVHISWVRKYEVSPPGVKMHDSDPSMDRDIKICRQFDKVFETYCVLIKELEREKQLSLECFCK